MMNKKRSLACLIFSLFIASVPLNAKVEIHHLSSEIREDMIKRKTWSPACPVPLERLRRVKFSYVNFEGKEHHDGELIVMDVVAPHLSKVLEELHKRAFPINKARRIELYNGNDEIAMADNNSSAFNYRVIEGTTTISIHGYGLAIDINPLQNPFVSNPKDQEGKEYATVEVYPKQGKEFLNRSNQRPGMDEPIVDLFAKHGFRIWGGKWNDPMDFHHFQTPRWLAETLAEKPAEEAQKLFDYYVDHPEISTKEDLLKISL